MKNILRKRKVILSFVFAMAFMSAVLFTTMHADAVTATSGGTVTNAEELNRALGGNHKVNGNTVILQDDVTMHNGNNSTPLSFIRIENTSAPLVLDMNGKSIKVTSETYAANIMRVSGASFTITGSGTFSTVRSQDKVLSIGKDADVTIENGTFHAKNSYVIVFGGGDLENPSHLTINGGDFGTKSIYTDGAVANLTVNGGKLGYVNLGDLEYYLIDYPELETDDIVWQHCVCLNGGEIERLEAAPGKVTIKGGVIGAGGINAAMSESGRKSELLVQGGVMRGRTTCYGKMVVTGGKLGKTMATGIFVMKGGRLNSSTLKALTVSGSGTISGGTISSGKKSGKGIRVCNNSTLKVNSGKILSTNKGSAAIYAEKGAKVYFQAKKGSKATLKGFKYALYCVNSGAKRIMKTNSRLAARTQRAASYYAGQTLPKIIHGNATLVYTSIKKK